MIGALAKQFAPAARGAERGRGASSRQAERLANDVSTTQRFLSQGAIGFENEPNCFGEIGPGLLECIPLGVGTGELLNEGDIPLANLLEHCGQLELHDFPPQTQCNKRLLVMPNESRLSCGALVKNQIPLRALSAS